MKDGGKEIAKLSGAAKSAPGNADTQKRLGYAHRKQVAPNLATRFDSDRTGLQIDHQHKGGHEYAGAAWLMDRQSAATQKYQVTLEQTCGNKTCEKCVDLAEAIRNDQAKSRD